MTKRIHAEKPRRSVVTVTPEIDVIIHREFASCESVAWLAQQLGWSKHSVYQRARTLKLKRPRVDRAKQGLAAEQAKQLSMDSTRIVASALAGRSEIEQVWRPE